mmetsp:Transcript_77641/g.155510  ORF Transcript_77641/g.155510 Transcript_77641/m.155510 type:complete len:222 (+) Transcript_77641:579-1244(+)
MGSFGWDLSSSNIPCVKVGITFDMRYAWKTFERSANLPFSSALKSAIGPAALPAPTAPAFFFLSFRGLLRVLFASASSAASAAAAAAFFSAASFAFASCSACSALAFVSASARAAAFTALARAESSGSTPPLARTLRAAFRNPAAAAVASFTWACFFFFASSASFSPFPPPLLPPRLLPEAAPSVRPLLDRDEVGVATAELSSLSATTVDTLSSRGGVACR